MFDVVVSLGLLAMACLVAVAAAASRSRSERAEREGSSVLLGPGIIRGFYRFVEPGAELLARMRISAHAITLTSVVLGALAGLSFAFDHLGIGTVFGVMSLLCDALDGAVARRTGLTGKDGVVLDAVADRYVEFFLLCGLAMRARQRPVELALVLFAILGSFIVSYSSAKAETMGVKPPRGAMRRAERTTYLMVGTVFTPLGLWAVNGAWFGAAPVLAALTLLAIGANISGLRRVRAILRAARKAHRVPATSPAE